MVKASGMLELFQAGLRSLPTDPSVLREKMKEFLREEFLKAVMDEAEKTSSAANIDPIILKALTDGEGLVNIEAIEDGSVYYRAKFTNGEEIIADLKFTNLPLTALWYQNPSDMEDIFRRVRRKSGLTESPKSSTKVPRQGHKNQAGESAPASRRSEGLDQPSSSYLAASNASGSGAGTNFPNATPRITAKSYSHGSGIRCALNSKDSLQTYDNC